MVFMFSMAMIFLSVRDKSKATLHLGIAFLWMTLFFGGYFIAAFFYLPAAVYHRFITIFSVLCVCLHLTQVWFYFPEDGNVKARRAFFYIQYLIAFVVIIVFAVKTMHAQRVYLFDGHYWDFDADAISGIIALVILLFILVFLGTGIWRTIVTKTRERWTVFFISITISFATIFPAVLNTLSRDGMIGRETYLISQLLSTIVGFFFAGIIYINATTDRTNFMTKILGISLATILIVFQNLSWFSLQDLDNSYDSLCRKDLTIILDSHMDFPNLEYLAEYSTDGNDFKILKARNQSLGGIRFDELKSEFKNTRVFEQIRSLPAKDFKTQLKNLLNECDQYFAGYKNTILSFIETRKLSTLNPAGDVLARITQMNRSILYTYNKLKAMPDHDFRAGMEKFFSGPSSDMKGFQIAILGYASKNVLQGAELKNEVLKFLAPFNQAGTRIYRKSSAGDHYISFMQAELEQKVIFEAGFSYLSYKQYIHPTSTKFIYLLGAILLVIFIGFQFFFLGAFVRPLESLLKGMFKVSEGNLRVSISVSVEDELGFITHNFNWMVDNLRVSNEKLSDYSQNLEFKVSERTAELNEANDKLKKAMDSLWGEMELAKKIQTALLPDNPSIRGYDISAQMSPADEVGGDYYDVINVAGRDWVVIGDVSGHGVPAGLIMMMVQTAIQVVLVQHGDLNPSELLIIVNKTITQNIKKLGEDKYMTITVISCIAEGTFHFSGLHQDIMIYRAESGSVDLRETSGMWIGVMEDINGMIADESFSLDVGDAMILYSDGITEATKEVAQDTVEEFGSERLKNVFEEAAKGSAEEIRNAVFREMKNFTAHDDITIVVLKRRS